jgi:hypothetical protein
MQLSWDVLVDAGFLCDKAEVIGKKGNTLYYINKSTIKNALHTHVKFI